MSTATRQSNGESDDRQRLERDLLAMVQKPARQEKSASQLSWRMAQALSQLANRGQTAAMPRTIAALAKRGLIDRTGPNGAYQPTIEGLRAINWRAMPKEKCPDCFQGWKGHDVCRTCGGSGKVQR